MKDKYNGRWRKIKPVRTYRVCKKRLDQQLFIILRFAFCISSHSILELEQYPTKCVRFSYIGILFSKSIEHIDHVFLDCENIFCSVLKLVWRNQIVENIFQFSFETCLKKIEQVLHRMLVLSVLQHRIYLTIEFWKIEKARFDQIWAGCYPKSKENIVLISILTIMKLILGLKKGKLTFYLKWSFSFTFVHYMLLIAKEKT